MASGLFFSALSSFPAPLTLFTQLTLSSATIGLTPAYSFARPAAFSLISACVYSILSGARAQMRPRWASLLGGASCMFLLQYLDLGLVKQWNWRDRGPAPDNHPIEGREYPEQRASMIPTKESSTWAKFRWAWSSMFALRHINTKSEARNTPPFADSDPSWIPSKPEFLARESAMALLCYLLLDFMAQRQPSPKSHQLFDNALVPVFRRLGEVTLPQLQLRALSIAGFAVTFWALIRGYAAFAGTLTVAVGLNDPRDWRPPFGSLAQAYSVKNFWGKVWHQNLRSLLTGPAERITSDSLLRLPPGSLLARFCSVFISFALSGVMHSCAGIAAGMSPKQLNVLHFFITQAFGVMIEDLVRLVFLTAKAQKGTGKKEKSRPPSLVTRVIGYIWVAAFMTWSGPVWLYPGASRLAPPGTNNSFLPYSIIKAWKMADIRAG